MNLAKSPGKIGGALGPKKPGNRAASTPSTPRGSRGHCPHTRFGPAPRALPHTLRRPIENTRPAHTRASSYPTRRPQPEHLPHGETSAAAANNQPTEQNLPGGDQFNPRRADPGGPSQFPRQHRPALRLVQTLRPRALYTAIPRTSPIPRSHVE